MKSTLKTILFLQLLVTVVLGALYPCLTFAIGENTDYILLAPVPGITKGDCNFSDPNSTCTTDVSTFIQGGFRLVIGVASALAVLLIMFEGLQYIMTASEKNKTKSKERIKEILLGLLLAISSVLILNLVDPAFTRFKFDLGKSGSSTGGASLTSGSQKSGTNTSNQMTDEEYAAFAQNLTSKAADAQTTVDGKVAVLNEELQQNRDNLEKLKTALASAPDKDSKTLLQNTINDLQSRIDISQKFSIQAEEIRNLTDSGSLTAAEAKLREMSLYYDAQARAWAANASPDMAAQRQAEAAQIRAEGAAREKQAYLYYNQAAVSTQKP